MNPEIELGRARIGLGDDDPVAGRRERQLLERPLEIESVCRNAPPVEPSQPGVGRRALPEDQRPRTGRKWRQPSALSWHHSGRDDDWRVGQHTPAGIERLREERDVADEEEIGPAVRTLAQTDIRVIGQQAPGALWIIESRDVDAALLEVRTADEIEEVAAVRQKDWIPVCEFPSPRRRRGHASHGTAGGRHARDALAVGEEDRAVAAPTRAEARRTGADGLDRALGGDGDLTEAAPAPDADESPVRRPERPTDILRPWQLPRRQFAQRLHPYRPCTRNSDVRDGSTVR